VSQATGVCDICGKTWVGGHVCSYSNSTLMSGSESYHGKLDKPYKGPVEPSPLVIAADQLAQAASAMFEFTPEHPQRWNDLRTALANYKRVREG
jgi:hypothetical protein